jgi:hypothetical protein
MSSTKNSGSTTTAMPASMEVITRSPGATGPESPYEKLVALPQMDDGDPTSHAWADARFAADILAEHALFFALLMPEELAAQERAEAIRFRDSFGRLSDRIAGGPPPARSELKGFAESVIEPIKPFIEY